MANRSQKIIKDVIIKIVPCEDSYYPKKSKDMSNNTRIVKELCIPPKAYPGATLLKDLISPILSDPSKNLKYFTVPKYFNNNLTDKMKNKLEEIFTEGDEKTEHVLNLVYTGIRNLPSNINQTIATNTNFYATINYHNENKKELVVFSKDILNTNYLKINRCYNDIFDEEMNYIINEHTTICNAANYFYVSGCGIKGFSKSFMRVKLENIVRESSTNLIQKLADMPKELQFHVMLYVPQNYIFVIGGQFNSEESPSNVVYYYDIQENVWQVHSNLNTGRVEHSACLVNDQYIYAFFGNKNDKKNDVKTIERINLRSGERVWETIVVDTFDLSFFNLYAVCQYKNIIIMIDVNEKDTTNSIQDNNQRNLIFNLDTNKLSLYSSENIGLISEGKAIESITSSKSDDMKEYNNDRLDFFERSFIPIKENLLILSPFNHDKDKTHLVYINDGKFKNVAFNNQV